MGTRIRANRVRHRNRDTTPLPPTTKPPSRNRGSQSQFSDQLRPNRFSSSSSSSSSRRNSSSRPRKNPFSALSKDEILDRRNRVRRPGTTIEKEEKRAQTSRRPFSNGRGGPQRGEEEEEDVDVYDEPEGDVRGEEIVE